MGDTGKIRLQALLQGWVDHVVRPNGGIYVLGAGEAAVPISDVKVMLDILMSNQAADGVHMKSRTLFSIHVCLCIDDLLLAELHQLVAWPCDMAKCALICTHTCEDRTRVADARDPCRVLGILERLCLWH